MLQLSFLNANNLLSDINLNCALVSSGPRPFLIFIHLRHAGVLHLDTPALFHYPC
jgi:hypothetical protein